MTRQKEFRRRAAEALANPRIRENLGRFGTAYRTARKNALAGLDYEAHKANLRRMKEDAIERLPELAEQFTEAARGVGAIVYQFMINIALYLGLPPTDLRLVTGLLVIAVFLLRTRDRDVSLEAVARKY